MSKATDPLADLVGAAQKILYDHAFAGAAASGRAEQTIADLSALLLTSAANNALRQADWRAKQTATALEAARHKLAELREHYTGEQGRSLDRVQVLVGAALQACQEQPQ